MESVPPPKIVAPLALPKTFWVPLIRAPMSVPPAATASVPPL